VCGRQQFVARDWYPSSTARTAATRGTIAPIGRFRRLTCTLRGGAMECAAAHLC
jgi:hypothetical protein